MAIMTVCDLRSKLGPARNQGARPTCVAFALSDRHAVQRGATEPLSVEHLYYHAVQRTSGCDPGGGVTVPTCVAALAQDGQCSEVGWPYADPIPSGSAWVPPETAVPVFRRRSEISDDTVAMIMSELDTGSPLVVAMLLGERFYMPDPQGRIGPGPDDVNTDYHALLAVGHGLEGSEPFILVRNSWGADWGMDGYGWVSVAYLEPRLYALVRFPSEEFVG